MAKRLHFLVQERNSAKLQKSLFKKDFKQRVQGKTLKTVATETLNLMSNLKIKGW